MTRKRWIVLGGALLLVGAVATVALGAPAALALRLAGFRAEGRTDDFLDERMVAGQPMIEWAAAVPTATPAGATPAQVSAASDPDGSSAVGASETQVLPAVTVDIWFLAQPQTYYPHQIFATRLERGQTAEGRPEYYIEFNQEGINTYLQTWFGASIAQQEWVRNPWIDLEPGAVVVYADVDAGIDWQRMGVVMALDASGRQFVVSGVDIGGRLYSTPSDGRIAELVGQLETEGNRALRELTFLDPAGELRIQAINLDEERASILAY